MANLSFLFSLDSNHPDHGQQNFFCDDCGKGFFFNASLNQHKLKDCPGKAEKPKGRFKCQYCDQILSDTRHLHQHIDIKVER